MLTINKNVVNKNVCEYGSNVKMIELGHHVI